MILAVAPVAPAYAATLTVTGTMDELTTNGTCSLREALINANNDVATYPDCPAGTGADTIVLSSGATYTLILTGGGSVGGSLDAEDADGLTIQTDGAVPAAIDASSVSDRVIDVASGDLTLNNIIVQNGTASNGGGIRFTSTGALTLEDTTITDNTGTSSGYCGGGIYSLTATSISITNSSIANNSCTTVGADGGGILFNNPPDPLIEFPGGTFSITNSTFYNNSAGPTSGGNGGGLLVDVGSGTIDFSTFSNNTVTGEGGAIRIQGGTIPISNSTLANSNGASDCQRTGGTVDSSTSLIETNSGAGACGTPGFSADPGLGAYADNGGPTYTMSITSDSIAYNNAASCTGSNNEDQRGVTRPQFSICDLGAFELDDFSAIDTTTTVSCASPVTYGSSTSCTATVTRTSGFQTPSGSVNWATDASGSFAGSPCTLSDIGGGAASCSVSYTPGAVGDGSHLITATYAGDANFNGSSGNQSVTVDKANAVIVVTPYDVIYDGSPHTATGTATGVDSEDLSSDLDLSGTTHTDAGSYTGDPWTFTDTTGNYNDDSGTVEDNIAKATPTVSVTNSPVYYTGSPQAAIVEGSVAGTSSNVRYDGSSTEPTDVGTYALTADFAPTDSTNYNSLTGASAGDFVILEKLTPTLSVTNSPVTYNGSPQAAAVVGSVPGTVSDVKYDGSSTVPTDADIYAVTADFVPDDTYTYKSLSDAPAGNFVIEKATPTLSVTNSPVTYNGSPQAATVVSSVAGTVSNIQYGGSPTEPTNAGTYAVTADFTPTDTANYNSLSGASAGNFVIEKADPILSVTNSPVIYDGSPHAAIVVGSVPGTVSKIRYDGSPKEPTDVGTYAVTAKFVPDDTTNYNTLNEAPAGDFVITNLLSPTLSVTNSPVIYNGSPQAATVEGSVPGTVSDVKYNGSSTVPTDAGTYAVTADFVPDDTTTYISLSDASAGDFTISPKPVTVTAEGGQTKVYGEADPTFTYTSSDPSITFSGALSRDAGEDVGTYAITQGTLDAGPNYTTTFVSANFSITAKPVTVTADSGQSKVYGEADPTFTYASSDPAATFSGALGRDAGEDVGTYAITQGSLLGTGNYTIDSFVSAGFSIMAKPVTVTADSGQSKIYGETDPTYTYTSSDPSATFSGALGRDAGEDVGTYAITQGTLLGTGNYTIGSFVSADFEITAKPVTVTANSGQTKVYGEADPIFTYTSSDPAATFSGELSRDAGEDVGTYAITQGTLLGTGNYMVGSFISADFTITLKELTVTADDQLITYGDPEPDYTFTYAGFAAGEDENDLTTEPTCSVVENPHTDIGTYTIACSGGVANNYSFTYVNGTLTIKAPNTPPTDITLSSTSVVENQLVGTLVGILSTTDVDPDIFTYSLVDTVTCAGPDNASFSISGDQLLTGEVFDYQTKNSYTICIKSDDNDGGEIEKQFTISVDLEILTLQFRSQGKYDGWILEASETSGKGGAKNSTSKTFYVGDDAYNRQYRSVLSFNTAGLPDDAVITTVTLKIKKAGLVGTNPLKTHNGLYTDIRKGKFGTSVKLQTSDFQARASKNKVGKFKKASSGWYKAVLGSGAYPYVKLNGTTQFRVRFAKDDNNDFGADYLKFYNGNAGTTRRPTLIIKYYVP